MYCKNCGSIIANNSNFCHVCGAKVDIDDVFNDENYKKEEDSNDTIIKDDHYYGDEKRNFFDSYEYKENTNVEPQDNKNFAKRHPKLLALFSLIFSAGLLINAGILYGLEALTIIYAYEAGQISSSEYYQYASQILFETGFILALGLLSGLVLGIPGYINAKTYDQTKTGKRLAILSFIASAICLVFLVITVIYSRMLGV